MSSQQPLAQLAQLGVIGSPSNTQPQGLLVAEFAPSSEPWPLEILGVEKGDVIISVNGQQGQVSRRLVNALEVLEQQGEPVRLEIIRDGERVKLERTEKLPGASADQATD
jgi:S1-C subfamily serine protease